MTYFWYFLELFIEKYILNINNEHAQDYSCPGVTFAFCSHGEKLPQQGGLPAVVQWVTRLSKLPRNNERLMWTVTGVRLCTEAKLTLGSVIVPGQWVVMWSCVALTACSHDMIDPGTTHCPRATHRPRGKLCIGARFDACNCSHEISLPRGNFERRVTRCTTLGNPPCRGNFSPREQNAKVAPRQEQSCTCSSLMFGINFPIKNSRKHQKKVNVFKIHFFVTICAKTKGIQINS